MNTNDIDYNENRPAVYRFDRAFKRRASYGMQVQFSRTVTPALNVTIDHFELACPGYTLGIDGPEIDDNEIAEIE